MKFLTANFKAAVRNKIIENKKDIEDKSKINKQTNINSEIGHQLSYTSSSQDSGRKHDKLRRVE